jgi:CheY-like chemotaxis protein
LLAGRKLLLADDSATVQKVIDLTFADEGVEVIIAGDGEEAIEKVEQLLPDVVLVDVLMPVFNGYEVCEYIKTSEKLKHIPVMLLVGSFEPFDEAEARRVGANEILTKPFKSIRRLIDKVGELVAVKPPETEVPTAELPSQHQEPDDTRLSTAELEMTTADTMQLPPEMTHAASSFQDEEFVAPAGSAEPAEPTTFAEAAVSPTVAEPAPAFAEPEVQSFQPEPQNHRPTSNVRSIPETSDTLLDLGDLEPAETIEADEFELELDIDEVEATPAPFAAPAFDDSQVAVSAAGREGSARGRAIPEPVLDIPMTSVSADVRPAVRQSAQTTINAQDLSQEMIDVIARRAVEMLSEKVIQEIAWEVVPQLAEMLIKQRLDEKQSQPK